MFRVNYNKLADLKEAVPEFADSSPEELLQQALEYEAAVRGNPTAGDAWFYKDLQILYEDAAMYKEACLHHGIDYR